MIEKRIKSELLSAAHSGIKQFLDGTRGAHLRFDIKLIGEPPTTLQLSRRKDNGGLEFLEINIHERY